MHSVPLPPGALLKDGQYRIERQIGRGGLGIVYLAIDTGSGERYAVKETFDNNYARRAADGRTVVPRTDVDQAGQIHRHQCRRAHEEAQRFASPSLRHPCLVPLHESFDGHGTAYLVMPFIDGTPLHVAAGWPEARRPQWVLALLEQLAAALDTLHRNQLIHRDLKPDNVMIRQSERQSAPVPVLLDTGAARQYSDVRTVHTHIATDFGAPEIISLDEARRFGAPGPATDCFALAGIAYWLLSGNKPVPYAARVSELERTGGSGSDPLEQAPGLSDAVWQVLRRSLSLAVAGREASAVSLVRALGAALACHAPSPTPATTPAETAAAPAPAPAVTTAVPVAAQRQDAPEQDAPGAEVWVMALALSAALCLALLVVLGLEAGVSAILCLLLAHVLVAMLALRRGAGPARALLPLFNLRALWAA